MPVKKTTVPKNYKPYSSTPAEPEGDEPIITPLKITYSKIVPKTITKVAVKTAPKAEPKAAKKVSDRPKKGEGVSGIIINMLLENKSTYEDIKKAIAKKHGDAAADVWKNRISIFRADINAGRRCANRVTAKKVKLPLVRLERISGKLVPVK
jgi:hypothetical protein